MIKIILYFMTITGIKLILRCILDDYEILSLMLWVIVSFTVYMPLNVTINVPLFTLDLIWCHNLRSTLNNSLSCIDKLLIHCTGERTLSLQNLIGECRGCLITLGTIIICLFKNWNNQRIFRDFLLLYIRRYLGKTIFHKLNWFIAHII